MATRLSTRLTGVVSNLSWLLAPLLLIQGRRVRQRIVSVPEAEGERSGVIDGGRPDVGWLVLGDSTAAGVGAEQQCNALGQRGAEALHRRTALGVRWQVVGRKGRRIRDVRQSLSAFLPESTVDFVVIAVGVNDVTGWTSRRAFCSDLEALLDEIEQRFDNPRVLFSGLPPVHRFPALPMPLRQVAGLRAHFVDRVLRDALAARDNVQHVPLEFANDPSLFCADDFHPGVAAYEHWAEELARRAAADL